MNALKEQNITPKLSIYLHKYDHNLEYIDKSITDEMISDLAHKLIEQIPEGIEHIIFKTSIYTVFNKILFN